MTRRQRRIANICFDLMAIVGGAFISHEIDEATYDLRMAAIEAVRTTSH